MPDDYKYSHNTTATKSSFVSQHMEEILSTSGRLSPIVCRSHSTWPMTQKNAL